MTEEQKNENREKINGLLRIDEEEKNTEEKISKMARYIIQNKTEAEGLISWMKDNEFFTSPASTAFHGNYPGGLAEHSLCVTITALRLSEAFFETFERSPESFHFSVPTVEEVFIAGVSHDMCKAGLYETAFRNTKGEDGVWKKTEYYTVNTDNRNLGHGNESVLRLISCMPSVINNRMVVEAVSRHMGFSDVTPNEMKNMGVLMKNPLVGLIQTADGIAAAWFDR